MANVGQSHEQLTGRDACRLGQSAKAYLGNRDRELSRNASVTEALLEFLPVELSKRCTIRQITSTVLAVYVPAGPYMHEMRLLSHELLEHLQRRFDTAGIQKIKLYPQR